MSKQEDIEEARRQLKLFQCGLVTIHDRLEEGVGKYEENYLRAREGAINKIQSLKSYIEKGSK